MLQFSCSASSQEEKQYQQKHTAMWLKDILETGRISSNHYADLALDSLGHSYLACFETMKDGTDEIRIIKVDPNGENIWELGEGQKGRATTISITEDQYLWVGGVFQDQLILAGQSTLYTKGQHPFLALISPEGDCIQLIEGIGSGLIFNCRLSNNGAIWVSGEAKNGLSFGNQSLQSIAGNGSAFIARFEQDGKCAWIRQADGQIQHIRPVSKEQLIVSGGFYDSLYIADTILTTQGIYDNDAFLYQIDIDGQLMWARQYGQPGYINNGYRTGEYGLFIEEGEDRNELIMTDEVADSLTGSKRRLISTILDKQGAIIHQKVLLSGLNRGSIVAMAKMDHHDKLIGVSFDQDLLIEASQEVISSENAGILLLLDHEGKLKQSWQSEVPSDAIFRVIREHKGRAFISGHFREQIAIRGKKLEAGNQHHLFLLSIP